MTWCFAEPPVAPQRIKWARLVPEDLVVGYLAAAGPLLPAAAIFDNNAAAAAAAASPVGSQACTSCISGDVWAAGLTPQTAQAVSSIRRQMLQMQLHQQLPHWAGQSRPLATIGNAAPAAQTISLSSSLAQEAGKAGMSTREAKPGIGVGVGAGASAGSAASSSVITSYNGGFAVKTGSLRAKWYAQAAAKAAHKARSTTGTARSSAAATGSASAVPTTAMAQPVPSTAAAASAGSSAGAPAQSHKRVLCRVGRTRMSGGIRCSKCLNGTDLTNAIDSSDLSLVSVPVQFQADIKPNFMGVWQRLAKPWLN